MNKSEEKKKIKLSQLRNIMALASAIPGHKALSFRSESKINRLAAEAKAIILYHIGDEIESLGADIDQEMQAIRAPFIDEFQALEQNQQAEQEAEFNKRIQNALMASDKIKALKKQEDALWDKKVDDELEPFEVPDQEYAERFKEPKQVSVFGNTITIDGYQALLELITMDLITISDK